MDQKNNEQTMQLQLDIKPEVARGIYANLVLINHSHSDFVIDFAQALPGMPKPEVASRMIMAPEHAKRLLMALQENVLKYEQAFGRIDLGTAEDQRMIPPIAPTTSETNGITPGAIPIPLPITFAASATQCRADRGLGVRFERAKTDNQRPELGRIEGCGDVCAHSQRKGGHFPARAACFCDKNDHQRRARDDFGGEKYIKNTTNC